MLAVGAAPSCWLLLDSYCVHCVVIEIGEIANRLYSHHDGLKGCSVGLMAAFASVGPLLY